MSGSDSKPRGRAKKLTAAHKRAIALGMTGKKHTAEHRANNAAARRGKPLPAATRKKLSLWQQGRKLTEEHKQNIAKGLKGQTKSEETRARIAANVHRTLQSPNAFMGRAKANDLRFGESNLYIVGYPNLKGIYKVGVAIDLERRIYSARAWTRPLGAAQIHYSALTTEAYQCELKIHNHFKAKDEWVRCDLSKLIAYAKRLVARVKAGRACPLPIPPTPPAPLSPRPSTPAAQSGNAAAVDMPPLAELKAA